jgi:hypothetical protein
MKIWTITLKGQISDDARAMFTRDVEQFLNALVGDNNRGQIDRAPGDLGR